MDFNIRISNLPESMAKLFKTKEAVINFNELDGGLKIQVTTYLPLISKFFEGKEKTTSFRERMEKFKEAKAGDNLEQKEKELTNKEKLINSLQEIGNFNNALLVIAEKGQEEEASVYHIGDPEAIGLAIGLHANGCEDAEDLLMAAFYSWLGEENAEKFIAILKQLR